MQYQGWLAKQLFVQLGSGSFWILVATLAAANSAGAAAQTQLDDESGMLFRLESGIPDPLNTIARYGRGWDHLSSRVRGDCVIQGVVEGQLGSPSAPDGQRVEYDLDLVSSTRELRKKMQASASASFSFGVYAGSADASYLKEQQFSQLNQYLVATVKVLNATYTFRPLNLTKSGVKAFKKGLPNALEACGNEYVAGLQEGGSLYLLLEIASSSLAEKEELSIKVNAAIGVFRASGKLDQALEVLEKEQRVRMKLFRAGGQDASPQASLPEAIEYARTFPLKVRPKPLGNPFPIKALTADYNTTVEKPVPGNGEFLVEALHTLETLAEARDTLLDVLSDLKSVLRYPDTYEDITESEARQWIDSANAQLATVGGLAEACRRQLLKCTKPPASLVRVRRPTLKEILTDVVRLPFAGYGYRDYIIMAYNGKLIFTFRPDQPQAYTAMIQTVGGAGCFRIRTDAPVGGATFWFRTPKPTPTGGNCKWICSNGDCEQLPPLHKGDPIVYVAEGGATNAVSLRYRDNRWRFRVSRVQGGNLLSRKPTVEEYQYMAVCIEKKEHEDSDYPLTTWLDQRTEADSAGKRHDQQTKGHRWTIDERTKP
jgi:hypothetical protein